MSGLVGVFVYILVLSFSFSDMGMFLNLGSDRVMLFSLDQTIILPLRGIDRILSQYLVDNYKKSSSDTLYVLNGPGSFINVRLGVLAVNTLEIFSNHSVSFNSIDKLTLLYNLYRDGIIPRYGILYFGQRKNLALVDCHEQSSQLLPYLDIISHVQNQDTLRSQDGSFFVDCLCGDDFPYFVDHVQSIRYSYTIHGPSLCYRSQQYDLHQYFIVGELKPMYGIEVEFS